MMLKVNFCDFWPGFMEDNLFLRYLEKDHQVSIDPNPDYLFYSVYGNEHLRYTDCVKILYTGENLVPDFNLCDYALGFHYLEFGDRYLRFPLYIYYKWQYSDILKSNKNSPVTDSVLLNRKFCNFIYSNNVNSDPLRDKFFNELSRYKRVDSGGRHLNNINKAVEDKLQFIKDYKFTIAFENSSVPGYTTEKLFEPLIMKTLPVYYGNPMVDQEFNINSFVYVKDDHDFERAIEEIISLDKNDDMYLERINQPMMKNQSAIDEGEKKFKSFLDNIFSQPLSKAYRTSRFGYNNFYTSEMILKSELLEKKRKKNAIKAKLKMFLSKYLPFLRN